jgi:hypothetical protein
MADAQLMQIKVKMIDGRWREVFIARFPGDSNGLKTPAILQRKILHIQRLDCSQLQDQNGLCSIYTATRRSCWPTWHLWLCRYTLKVITRTSDDQALRPFPALRISTPNASSRPQKSTGRHRVMKAMLAETILKATSMAQFV